MSLFFQVPGELQIHMLGFLQPKELLTLRTTFKTFKKVAEEEELWSEHSKRIEKDLSKLPHQDWLHTFLHYQKETTLAKLNHKEW
jgi:hypothetical protein